MSILKSRLEFFVQCGIKQTHQLCDHNDPIVSQKGKHRQFPARFASIPVILLTNPIASKIVI